ncbi:carbohydrate porin [Vibrio sp. WXL210]|uniref:carbohydrate porin n=1 Tax=Vibrio sp. WXL210 TaxID=3450709 RepID=UPI003EC4F782
MRKTLAVSLLTLATLPYQSFEAHADDSFRLTGYARYGMGYSTGERYQNFSYMNGINTIKSAGSQYALTGHLANQGMGHELGFEKKWSRNDSNWRALFMATDNYNADPWRTAQMWAGGSNVIKSNPTAEVWAGQRYAQRVQMLLNNYKPLLNDGVGGGIKNFDLGFGKANVEVISGIRNNGQEFNRADSNGRYALLTSLNGIRLGEGNTHTLDFYANYGFSDGRDREFNGNEVSQEDSYQLGAMYNWNRKGNWTKFFVRYGDGVKENIVMHRGPSDDGGSLGIFLYGHEKITDKFSMMYAFSHENNNNSNNAGLVAGEGKREKWYQGVLRGGYYYNKHHSTWIEAAYDTIDLFDNRGDISGDYGTNSSWKITVSQNVSLADFMFARPIVHFYASYGGLDTEIARNGAKLGVNDGFTFGTYFEVFM